MLKKTLYRLLVLNTVLVLFSTAFPCVAADDILFSVNPSRCIALRRGQYCYQSVRFRWVTPDSSQYCLYQKDNAQPLTCWQGSKVTSFNYEFKQKEGRVYFLKNEATQNTLAQVNISVAWVYKNSGKVSTGWRLF